MTQTLISEHDAEKQHPDSDAHKGAVEEEISTPSRRRSKFAAR